MAKLEGQAVASSTPTAGPLLSVRFVVSLVLMVARHRLDRLLLRGRPRRPRPRSRAPKPGCPAFMADLGNWNYLIGFGADLPRAADRGPPVDPARPRPRRRGRHARLLPDRPAVDLHVLRDLRRQPAQGPGLQRPRPVEPVRRHRLHGRRLHLRHPLGVSPSARARRAADEAELAGVLGSAEPRSSSDTARSPGDVLWSTLDEFATCPQLWNHLWRITRRVVLPRFVPSRGQPLR